MISLTTKLLSTAVVWAGGVGGLVINKCLNYSGDAIILGTYEDYMSPEMEEHIDGKYKIKLDYFTHDQIVRDRFKNGSYDMAVVSTSILEELITEQLAQEVKWNELNLKKSSTDNNAISDANGAKDLFTDVVKKIVGEENQPNKKFLDYGIPYFMNKLSFCYSGAEITGLKTKVKWSKVLEEVAKDSRFKAQNGTSKLGLIEDPRTVLSLSRFAYDQNSVNSNNYSGSDAIFADYKKLLTKLNAGQMGKNFLYLEGVSSQLVDALVSGGISGAFMYNADCLYASYGGNLGEGSKPEKDKLHIVEIEDDIYFLDFLVLSKKVSEEKRKKIYEFYKSILMNGHDQSKDNILDTGTSGSDVQHVSHNPNNYKYWLTKNFDYVRYTPVVKNLDDGVQEKYFDKETDHKEYRKKAAKVEFSNSGGDIKNHYETYFSSKVKSDMLVAFSRFKEQL